MSKRALWIKNDETKETVYAGKLTKDDRDKDFRCIGICRYGPHRGKTCDARLTLFICNNKDNYFAAAGASEHKIGCPYCQKSKEKTVMVLSKSCHDKNDTDILAEILGNEEEHNDHPDRGRAEGRINPIAQDEDEETDEDIDLIVKRKPRLPKNADELYDVLTTLYPDDLFAQKPVSEWIIDKRTSAEYYSAGLKEGQIALAVLGKISPAWIPKELNAFTNQYFIFPCTADDWHQKVFFLLPKDVFLERNVIYDQQIKQFAVLATWDHADTKTPAFICNEAPNNRQVTFKPNELNV